MNFNFETFVLIIFTLLVISLLLIVHWFLKYFMMQQRQVNVKENNKQMLTLRLQAYERMALFLERIHPESLIIREQQSDMLVHQFHSYLLSAIRREFEHNIAMQIYIPGDTWEMIRVAREEIVKLINTSAAQVAPNAPSLELGKIVIEQGAGSSVRLLNKAIEKIREDVALL